MIGVNIGGRDAVKAGKLISSSPDPCVICRWCGLNLDEETGREKERKERERERERGGGGGRKNVDTTKRYTVTWICREIKRER